MRLFRIIAPFIIIVSSVFLCCGRATNKQQAALTAASETTHAEEEYLRAKAVKLNKFATAKGYKYSAICAH